MKVIVLTSTHSEIHKDMVGEAKPMDNHGYEVTFPKVENFLGEVREVTVYMLKSEVTPYAEGVA